MSVNHEHHHNHEVTQDAELSGDQVSASEAFESVPSEALAPLQAQAGFDVLEEAALAETPPEAAAPEAEPETEQKGIGYLPPSTTVQQDADVFFPLEGEWNPLGTFLIGVTDTKDRTTRALADLPNVDPTATESGREWVGFMDEALNNIPKNDRWRASVDREGSEWRQTVKSERGPINMGAINFKTLDGENLAGEKGILQVRALLKLGSVIQTPLWHSGFHVSIKAPGDTALLELNRRLLDEKIVLGRTTNGLAFANASSYLTGGILDFVFDHIYDTSLQEKDMAKVRALVDTRDLPLLFWGLACSIWTRGFQYARPYIDPVTNEEKILREKLALGKLLWVDTKALTPWQISHMARRGSSMMTLDNVKRYRSEFTIGEPRRIQLREDLAMTLVPPSANDYVLSGYKWINEITRMVDEALALPPEDGRRASYIVEHGKATNMRQYIHWVSEIHPGNAIITDQDTIEQTIDDLSADDEVRRKYFTEVQKFIDESTIAVIATPTATPSEEKQLPRFPHLLPMNVEQTFFTLLEQKVSQISLRT